MRLSRPSLRDAESTASWRSALVLSVAVLGACSLDSNGADPPSSAASASSGSASSTGGGPGPGPSSVSSAGEGAGPASSSSGDGGAGATGGGSPSAGGGGAGDGGSGASGPGGGGTGGATGGGGTGGEGGSGPLDEWLLRVHGNNNQTVNDVVVGRGGFVYVVGTATYDDVKVDGSDTTFPIDDNDEVFAAKISADGTTVAWFVSFGGNGVDRGYSIAIGRDEDDDEHLYIGGVAQGTFSDVENFVPDADAPTNEWGFVMELGLADGHAIGGTVWGNVNLDRAVDVTTVDGVAFAVGTCQSNCADSFGTPNQGEDVVLARYPFDDDDDAWSVRLIARPGDQRGIAIAADPSTRGFALLGEMREASYDPGLGVSASDCNVVGRGGADAFVATYEYGSLDFVCRDAIGLGSDQEDQAHALAYDGANAYAAVTLGGDDPGQIGVRGTYIVATKGSFNFAAQLTTTQNSNAFALVLDGAEALGIAGRVDDRGFIQTMRPDEPTLGPRRPFTDNFNQARGLAISGQRWFVGGIFENSVNFGLETGGAGGGDAGGGGGGPPTPPVPITAENARDGWIARLNRPD